MIVEFDNVRKQYNGTVALDDATVDNGCLRVVRGSHQLGRLEHEHLGSQQIADRQRVAWALEEMDEVACEMTAGSVLYFHGNILHASNPNRTRDASRWCLIFAYVPASNRWVRPDEPHLTEAETSEEEAEDNDPEPFTPEYTRAVQERSGRVASANWDCAWSAFVSTPERSPGCHSRSSVCSATCRRALPGAWRSLTNRVQPSREKGAW